MVSAMNRLRFSRARRETWFWIIACVLAIALAVIFMQQAVGLW